MSRPQETPRRATAWSRRRAAVQAEAEADARAVEQAKIAADQTELEQKTDDEILSELNVQDPDTLQPGDNFAAFMKSAVPERIRRRALRKLWLSNPVLANVDNLVDYGEDFKANSMVSAVIKTTYQVGKGMLKHTQEMERQAREAELASATAEETAMQTDDKPADDVTDKITEEAPQEETVMAEVEYISPLRDDIQEDTPELHAKRRMRFAFDEVG